VRYAILCLTSVAAFGAPLLDDAALVPFEVPPAGSWDSATSLAWLSPTPAGQTGFVAIRDGHFVDGAGQRLRFIGGALAFDANFPDRAGAEQLAARLQMVGMNLVRLHHMDMGTAPRGIWDPAHQDRQHLDAEQLDRLDYLAAQLKAHGVYLNLNLHVSRKFSAADGFPEAGALPNYDKGVDNYEPRMIELQKAYAREMLTRVNPYTKTRWADEPALAMVEINNENSLLQMALKGELQNLPDRYVAPLRERWNAWLKAKYGTTAKLRAAWGAVTDQQGVELVRNGDFAAGTDGWSIQSTDLTSAERTNDGPDGKPCLTVTFGSPGKLAWSHQIHQMGLTLEAGKVYTATYALRSEQPAVIATSARLDHAHTETGRYEMIGPDDKVRVGPQWQTFTYTFLATRYAGEGCRFGFTFPNAKGTYQLAQMSLRLGGAVGLEQGETLEAGNVACPLGGAQLVATRRDFAAFLIEVERDYTQGMYRFVKDELGVKCPVIDTQASYGGPGGLLREAALDYVDMHAYWQHPKYIPKPGGGQTFELDNSPMVASDGGILVRLAEHRLRGRAFTVSEFNHAAPSYYQAEAWPMMATFAARQDWDGLVIHNYLNYGSDSWQPGHAANLFDTATNPAKAVFLPAAALLFRTGAVPPAQAESVLKLPREEIPALMADGALDMDALWTPAGLDRAAALDRRMSVELTESGAKPVIESVGEAQPGPLTWNRSDPERPYYTVVSDPVVMATGYLSGRTLQLGPVSITLEPTQSGCATIAVTAMDGRPLATSARILVSGLGRTVNSGAVWREDGRSLLQWGTAPTLIEPLRGTVSLQSGADLRGWRLNGAGNRAGVVAVSPVPNGLALQLDPAHGTAWYELNVD